MILDLAGLSTVADYFVLATGTSARQMRTVVKDLDEQGDKIGWPLHHASGVDGETWMALDFVDVVVHLFNQESRLFYDLDGLWADARRIDFNPAEPPKA